jgi:hypothetical protein
MTAVPVTVEVPLPLSVIVKSAGSRIRSSRLTDPGVLPLGSVRLQAI